MMFMDTMKRILFKPTKSKKQISDAKEDFPHARRRVQAYTRAGPTSA